MTSSSRCARETFKLKSDDSRPTRVGPHILWMQKRYYSKRIVLESDLYEFDALTHPHSQYSRQLRFNSDLDLVKSLVEEEKCFATEAGAIAFGNACASNVEYNDCFERKPFVGKEDVTKHMQAKVAQRKGRGDVRIDKISDGTTACGFGWTWVSGNKEGLRGTTFVELNDMGQIQYVMETPEPLFKPGNLTVKLLKAVTKDAKPSSEKPKYTQKDPKTANELVKYLFLDVQGSEIDEVMRLFDDSICYRDFNFKNPMQGQTEVRQFLEDFSFPGIEFRPQRFCDGIDSTCLTWQIRLESQAEDDVASIRGVSFYELDPESKKVVYVRDVPESALKPPPLGKLARMLRPGLGVFRGVPIGSRPDGR
eukprot:scaffold584_cov132-Cylindrotheca_fusiformis.AAC.22